MAGHTPGLWRTVRSPHGDNYLCVQVGADPMYTTLEMLPADARLAAASPALLAALAELLDWASAAHQNQAAGEWDDPDLAEVAGRATAALALVREEGTADAP